MKTDQKRREFEARVLNLQDEALEQYRLGRTAAAVSGYRAVCNLVRWQVEAHPDNQADVQQLGSMLYTLGEWEMTLGEFSAAVDSLTRAESAYEDLVRLGGRAGSGNPEQLVADVVIRRARVQAAAGHHLSALVDAQQAVLRCLPLATGPLCSPQRLDAARVVALAGQVQLLVGGDLDLVVGAVDWAIRQFVGGRQAGDALEVRPADQPAFHIAASVAHLVHSASGRTGPATMAEWFATVTAAKDTDLTLPTVDEIRARPTLAGRLTADGHDRYVGTLTAPATEVTLLVPAMRVSQHSSYGETLAGLRDGGDGDGLYALEAHALFAAASAGGDIQMRYQFGHYGRVWAQLLLSVGRQGPPWLATDAATWLAGVLAQLTVHAIYDDQARQTVDEAQQWLHELSEQPVRALRGADEATSTPPSREESHETPTGERSLIDESRRLALLDRPEEALAAIDAAVQHYRQLTAQQPGEFLSDLAMALNNRSVRLAKLDRFEEALSAIDEAVQLYRQLAVARPDELRHILAEAVANQMDALVDVDRHEEALRAADEVVQHYRQLAKAQPGKFSPGLAMALTNRSDRLAELDRFEEALSAIDEAVQLYRRLAAERPDVFRSNLAMALDQQSILLGGAGRLDEALTAADGAVQHYRQLAAAGEYHPNLPDALTNQSVLRAERLRRARRLHQIGMYLTIGVTIVGAVVLYTLDRMALFSGVGLVAVLILLSVRIRWLRVLRELDLI